MSKNDTTFEYKLFAMVSLLLSIISSTVILILFKIMDQRKISIFPPIVINYIVATTFGFSITSYPVANIVNEVPPWFYMSIIIGVMLIVNFYFVGGSTKTAGIAVTTVAAKMSFVLPVIYSLTYDIHDKVTLAKLVQIILACVAVLFVVAPLKNNKLGAQVLYPIILFFGLGLLDTLVKVSQYNYITDEASSAVFSAMNFGVAGLVGLVLLSFNKRFFKDFIKLKVVFLGIVLGLANFGSMYFLINALNDLKINNSLVFGINNIGILGLSVLVAFAMFSEKFSKIKWLGLLLSLIVMVLMLLNF